MKICLRVCALLVSFAALSGSGCQSVDRSNLPAPLEIVSGVTHRDQLTRAVGLPLRVYYAPGGGETLIYSRIQTKGLIAGVSVLYSPFRIGQGRSSTDSILIDISEEGIVTGVRSYGDPDKPGYSIWPGGDGDDGS